MAQFIAAAKKFVVAEEGASLVEYGLLVALIAVVCIAGVKALGGSISGMFNSLSSTITSSS
jgi:pilus assembly protein Flp/PilA